MESCSSAVPREVTEYLAKLLDVCNRLQSWAGKPSSSPLIHVTQANIGMLVDEVRLFAQTVLSAHDLNYLEPIQWRIMEAQSLLDFCLYHERNATGLRGSPQHIIREIRLRQAAGDFFSSWKDEMARFNSHLWGIPSKDLPSPAEFLGSFWARLTPFIENLADECSPRHIRQYTSADEVPYRVDTSAIPNAGSFGTVSKVFYAGIPDPLAVKTFETIQEKMPNVDRKKILREIGILEVCQHPNIVQFVEAYEVEEKPNSIQLVMAPWAPYTLLKFIWSSDKSRKANCPWFTPRSAESHSCIYRMMYEIADAVSYLHGLHIKHKDIKPDNILLYHEGTDKITPLIADLGISKVYRPDAKTGYTDSSYQYLAPEQLEKKESSLKADIWQLGCCFAMIVSVAAGGSAALYRLWDSFVRDDADCSCNIAREHGFFIGTLADICDQAGVAPGVRHLYGVISRMLDLDCSKRIDIGTVKAELDKLPRQLLD